MGVNRMTFWPWWSSSATKQLQKFFVADEDLCDWNILLLTSLLWEVLKYHERHNKKPLDKIGYWKDSSVLFLTFEKVYLPHPLDLETFSLLWAIVTELVHPCWVSYGCTYVHTYVVHTCWASRGLLYVKSQSTHSMCTWICYELRDGKNKLWVCVWWVLTGCVLPLTCRSASAASSWWPLPRDGCPWS